MMATSGRSEANPYVGPRSIQQGERFYGRREELRALYCELQARRIVVLHSPSGAGKSSLVQAGLIPRLLEEKFDVWRPIRVNLDPAGLEGEGVPKGTNRYLLSAMLSLEEELPEGKRRSVAELAGLDLGTYLRTRPRRRRQQGRPVVLLFDQFEEVLTVAPRAVAAKQAFFTALGRALKDEGYWALFIIREDYLAAFAPYRDRIPTRLANTVRLDLLGLAGAREAALRPALEAGREFPAVDQLVRDLSTVQVQQADGSFVAEPGLYVEPVQLQVVCRRLWGAMPAGDRCIDEDQIEQHGRVSDSLARYYASAVEEAAGGDLVVERAIRRWMGSELVKGGIRSQVRQGPGQSGGLDNALIQRLLDSYLIRTEQRASANWYELSHDRLVEPIQQDNEEWERAHLHPLQVQAKLWEDGRRARALLLGGDALPEAVAWARDNAAQVTESEREFLEQSQAARAEERRRRRGQRVFMAMISVMALVAISLWAFAWAMRGKAEQNARDATLNAWDATLNAWVAKVYAWNARHQAWVAEENAKRAEAEKAAAKDARSRARDATWMGYVKTFENEDPTRALLGLRSVESSETTGWLQDVLDVARRPIAQRWLEDHDDAVVSAIFSHDGKRIVTASSDGTARVWNANTGAPIVILEGHEKAVRSASFSPDGKRIVTASDDETARVWNADDGVPIRTLEGHEKEVASASFSPDGKRILTASYDHTARVWRANARKPIFTLRGHEKSVVSANFSRDGEHIVTASFDRTARVWSASTGKPILALQGHAGAVRSASFSPDGKYIVTASDDKTARIWTLDPELIRNRLKAMSTLCVPPRERIQYLGDPETEALQAFYACEREYGRSPSPATPAAGRSPRAR
ncbi:MAG: WD40 repeat domain-containing protein [Myxococcales bacterium]|nr:WD40 repeat domain-containing protein [Myxococcales bacterium]